MIICKRPSTDHQSSHASPSPRYIQTFRPTMATVPCHLYQLDGCAPRDDQASSSQLSLMEGNVDHELFADGEDDAHNVDDDHGDKMTVDNNEVATESSTIKGDAARANGPLASSSTFSIP